VVTAPPPTREDDSLELGSITPLVRRWWALIAAATLIAGGTAYYVASRVAPTYEAHTRLVTGPLNTDFDTLRASSQLAETYAELATSTPVLRRALGRARTPTLPIEDFRESMSATANEVTRLIRIQVKDEDGRRAAALANGLAQVLTEMSSRPPARPEGRLTIVDPAEVPTEPVAPRIPLIVFLATVAGLVASVAVVVVVDHGRQVVQDREDVSGIDGLDFLGSLKVPKPIQRARASRVVETAPESRGADAYRILAARLVSSDGGDAVRSIMVAGTTDDADSGVVALNLAAALAERNSPVTLIDANAAAGVITRALKLDGSPGYSDLVGGGESQSTGSIDRLIVSHSDRLDVIPRGSLGQPGAAGASRRLIEKLLSRNGVVVVGCPSLTASPTALTWLACVDAALVVAEAGRATRETLDEAGRAVAATGIRTAGITLTRPTLFSAA
jgi:receptor protein-tyrosine kinase